MFRSTQDAVLIDQEQNSIHNQPVMLDAIFSKKKLGVIAAENKTTFRIFAPRAFKVILCIFDKPEDEKPSEYILSKDKDGVWENSFSDDKSGKYYGYKVINSAEQNDADTPLCLDPYAKAVTTLNTYLSPRKGIIIKEGNYDWECDTWVRRDWRDLTIYEMHIRDMTAHSSSGAEFPGTYYGLIQQGIKGGIEYIKSLGVNTVELLPSMEFANIELPYKQHELLLDRENTWNPYERNHWGYMTAAFFAPAAYYAEEWKSMRWGKWEGRSGRQVNAFKDMVKAFHKNGIGVIMDVVFNHLSEYEYGNLKEIDAEYYFRLDGGGNFISESYCGNDLKTERPMVRRLIIDSILYWMKEYHIDGFRFDLGKLVDWLTIEDIIHQARKINPDVVFVCEPWGGGYDPTGFSLRGWGAWNDQIRNGIKGENPYNGLGWIFGEWYGNNSIQRIKSYIHGTIVNDSLGLFQKKDHSVNYLESHDGYTLGDFIRIGSREVDPASQIDDVDKHIALSPRQMSLNKLGALFLLTSQGIAMISAGQEFARSKVIPKYSIEPVSGKGRMDHNSYDKDNETNYINYKHTEINKDLVNYYKGLIALRNKYVAFRHTKYNDISFFDITGNDFAVGYELKHNGDIFLVLMNAHQNKSEEFILPNGDWDVLVSPTKAGVEKLSSVKNKLSVSPVGGYVLKRRK